MKHFKKLFHNHFFLCTIIIVVAFFLRVYRLDQVPPSPYWEEVAIGYDAFSILRTGKDHHGIAFPLVAFISFGDYKPALYFYAVAVSEFFFGLNTFAVRFPSALAGTLLVVVVGLIAKELFGEVGFEDVTTKKEKSIGVLIQYITMIIMAISPWAILFSRGGWEVNLATLFVTSGMYFGIKSWQKVGRYLFLSAFFLILSMYTYHATRVIAPLLGVFIAAPWLRQWRKSIQTISLVGIFSFLLLLPIISTLGEKTTSQRFAETSIFSDITVIEQSNALIAQDGGTFLARLVHHRYILFGKQILLNYFSHFDLGFLFLHGDVNPRHSVQFYGQLYYIEFIFLLLGIYFLIRFWKQKYAILLIWLGVSIFPASITLATPHALRILPALPVFVLLISAGIVYSVRLFSQQKNIQRLIWGGIILAYFVQFVMFWNYYQLIYPKKYASEWQFGYQELIHSIAASRLPNEDVYITREQGRPAMYYWFYSQTDPQLVQEQNDIVRTDQSEFLQFEKIHFVDGVNGEEKGLITTSLEKFSLFPNAQKISEVKDLQGKVIWVLFRN